MCGNDGTFSYGPVAPQVARAELLRSLGAKARQVGLTPGAGYDGSNQLRRRSLLPFEELIVPVALGRRGPGNAMRPKALARPLPQAFAGRPKTGVTGPIWKWLRHAQSVDARRRVDHLRRPNVHDFSRWAFSMAAHLPEARNVLR